MLPMSPGLPLRLTIITRPQPASFIKPMSSVSQLNGARQVFQRMLTSDSINWLQSDLAWPRGRLNPLSTKNTFFIP